MKWLLDLFQSIVFQTVMSGVLVFVLSEIIQNFFLKPLQKYKEVIGKTDNQLKFYANVITSPAIFCREKYIENALVSCGVYHASWRQVINKFLSKN